MSDNNTLSLPEGMNYIGAFLTMQCNFRCSYCINGHETKKRRVEHIDGKKWVEFFSRLDTKGIPITLQGGEPSIYKDFYFILESLGGKKPVDILTNLSFDIDEFMERIPPEFVNRPAPYASIRVSFHPQFMDLEETIVRMRKMLDRGYKVGLYGVMHPESVGPILEAKTKCLRAGVEFRIKPFLGFYQGALYGRYRYVEQGAFDRTRQGLVECRTSDFLIGPAGGIYRCHNDLYSGGTPIAYITDDDLALNRSWRECEEFGFCEFCDLKVKNNRFQQFGHTTVEIKGISAAKG